MILYVESKNKKQAAPCLPTHRKRDQTGATGDEVGEGKLDAEGQKIQTSSYKISTNDVMYNMITIAHSAV